MRKNLISRILGGGILSLALVSGCAIRVRDTKYEKPRSYEDLSEEDKKNAEIITDNLYKELGNPVKIYEDKDKKGYTIIRKGDFEGAYEIEYMPREEMDELMRKISREN